MYKKRLYNIDLIKGILIIFVIIGHILLGKVSQNIVRYSIYSFHMPIFITVSGFLINKTVLRNMTLIDVLKKYIPRLMIPWFFAVVLYCTILNRYKLSSLSLKDIVDIYTQSFIKPYYHLWFILGFIAYVFVTWLLLRLRLKNWLLLTVAFLISIISKLKLYHINSESGSIIIDILHYDFRIYNLFFFIFGMLLKEYISKKKISKRALTIAFIIVILAWVANIYLYYNSSAFLKGWLYYLLNIPFAFWLLTLSSEDYFPRCRIIEFIGKNSMAFYLWHVIVKLGATAFSGKGNVKEYYVMSLFMLIVLYAFIYLFSKNSFINQYFFGSGDVKRNSSSR